jgi:hypothetical protein
MCSEKNEGDSFAARFLVPYAASGSGEFFISLCPRRHTCTREEDLGTRIKL